ncbi:uncharacterized protein LOC107364151 [Tetranychus urticae]|uniref:Uncharacterized protein n=1 Tax=Tetranychus urticae TaxID=32264 RepID=T1KHK5_TETUR|nr:uncharacterized protein LOC107364151 [Tetranychus urticae]
MDQFKVSIIVIITLFPFYYRHVTSGHQIELISATSIYPCLDTYDILVNVGSGLTGHPSSSANLSSSHDQMIELIRVYSTNDPSLHLRQYYYLKEFKVPFNRLIKISCTFFNPETKYYCFSYVSMHKINSSIALWTQPECKFTLDNLKPSHGSYESHHIKDVSSNVSQAFNSEVNIKTNNSTTTNGQYQFAILSNHGPSYRFTSAAHETSNDYKKSDLTKRPTSLTISYLPLKLVKCRCSHLIAYHLHKPELGTNITVNQLNHSSSFLLEIFPCSKSDTLCNNSTQPLVKSIFPSADSEPLCLVNLTRSRIKLSLQIVKSLSCDTISSSAPRHAQPFNQQSQLPIIRDGLFAIDPQLEVTSESTNTHQLESSFLRIETPTNRYYLIHVTLIDSTDVGSGNFFTSFIAFFSSFQLIWLALIALTSFIVISILIFLCIYLIVPIHRKLKVQILLLDDLANTSTSFVDASSLEQFDFDESGSLEMDYYDYEMHSTTKGSTEKLSKSSDSVIK